MFTSRLGRTISSVLLVTAVVAVALSGWSVFAQTRTTPAAQSAQAPTDGASMPRTITVVGRGTVSITPDIATAQIGVETTGQNVRDAIDDASDTMAEILDALTEAGVAERDIQTAGFNVWADRNPQPMPMVEGSRTPGAEQITYRVNNNVRVIIRDLETVGAVIDAAVEAGANSIYGVNFGIDEPEALASEAREEAIADALAKAEELAALNGVQVGEVVSVSEIVGQSAVYGMERAALMADGLGGAGPFTPGEQEVSLQLQVVYAIR
jgi:uncharacterized protein YggE